MMNNMKKNFLLNLSFLVFVNLVVKPFWIFGIDRTVQNTVGTVDYGAYFTIFNYAFLFHILLDLGINNFNSKTIAQEPNLVNRYLPNILLLKASLTVLYLALCFAIAFLQNFSPLQWKILIWLCLNQVLASLILYFRSNLQGLHLFKTDSLFSVLDRLLMIVFCGLLLWGGIGGRPFQIEWFVYAQTVAYTLTALVGGVLVFRQLTGFEWQWQGHLVKDLLKESLPFALVGLLMTLYNRLDAVMMDYLLPTEGEYEAGVYALAYRLLDACNMIAMLFGTLLIPMFSRLVQEKERDQLLNLVAFSGKLLFVFSFIVAIGAYFYQEPIILLLYAVPSLNEAMSIFGYLMLTFVASSSIYVFGSLMVAGNHIWELNYVALLGLLLNVIFNYWLIPLYGAQGAVIATLITQFIAAGGFAGLALYRFQIPIKITLIVRIALFMILTIVLGQFLVQSPLFWLWSGLLFGVLALLVALVLGLIEWRLGGLLK